MFLSTRNEEHEELSDDAWLLDLGFLTDLTAKLNSLNNELQGKDRHLPHMISAVKAFKAKLGVWTTHLKKGVLMHFTNLEKMSQSIRDNYDFHPEQYCVHLDKLAADWSSVDVLVSYTSWKILLHLSQTHSCLLIQMR